jgi:ABC-type branched-subunit amino acid transport system substrate-binding protein
MRLRTSRLVITLCVPALLLGGACGSDGDSSSSGTTPASTNPKPKGAPIKIAVMAPVDGVAAQPEILGGAQAAAAAINDAGGVKDPAGGENRPIELVECRIKASDDPEAVPRQCAKDAIADGVVALASKYSFSEQANTEFEKAGIPMVGTLGVSAGDYANPNVFMLNTNLAGTAGAGAALQQAGAEKIAFISADNPAARFLPQYMTPVLKNGKDDLINETYLPLDPSVDVTPFVARVMRANPDGVAIVQSSDFVTKLIAAFRQAGYQGKIAAPGISPSVIEKLGASAEGVINVGNYEAVTTADNTTIKQYTDEVDRYAKDTTLDEFSLNAWLSVHFIADQLAELPKLDAPSLLKALNAAPTADLGVAPPFKLGDGKTYMKLPRIPRATVQFQKVEDGKIVADGEFVDLDTLANN